MRRFSVAVFVLVAVLSSVARAEDPTPVIGVADRRGSIRCKTSTTRGVMSFKPEMEIKDLVTWAIGFTCKPFMLAPNIRVDRPQGHADRADKMTRQEATRCSSRAVGRPAHRGAVRQGLPIVEGRDRAHAVLRSTTKSRRRHRTRSFATCGARPTRSRRRCRRRSRRALGKPATCSVLGSLVLVTDYGSSVRDMITLSKLIDRARARAPNAIYTLAKSAR